MASTTWTFTPLPPLPPTLLPNTAFYNATSSTNLTYQISLSYPFEWGTPTLPTTTTTTTPPNRTAHTIYILDGNAFASTASDFLKRRKPVDASQPDALVVGIGYPLTDSVYAMTQRAIDFDAPIPGEPVVPNGREALLEFVDAHLRPWVRGEVFPGVEFGRDALFGHSSGGLFVVWGLVTRPEVFDTWIAASPSLTLGGGEVIGEVARRLGDGMGGEGEVVWSGNGTRPAVFVGYGEGEDYPVRRRTQTEGEFQTRRKLLQSFSPGKWSHELYDRLVGSGSLRDVVLKEYAGQEHANAGGSALMDGIAYFLDCSVELASSLRLNLSRKPSSANAANIRQLRGRDAFSDCRMRCETRAVALQTCHGPGCHAWLDARVGGSGSLSSRGTVNPPKIAIGSLEEQLSKVEEELKAVEEQISTKITHARIKRLEMLKQIKERVKAKLHRDQNAIQAMLDSMDDDDEALVSARAKAAKDARGKESSSLSHQDTVDVFRMAIERLEEDYSNVEEELKGFEEMELM
ncbi:Alpha/Beta hydrolase protein [Chaetomium tenue]|uniref:Alpha/Beta hydrolase protein n=1 Tax=Chaetomium tenue TaxID=1854479 RepID=A0ACB7PL05_9PEZI|nr:Alpha/Beta hydrolase protein [Chaetomium globosum]